MNHAKPTINPIPYNTPNTITVKPNGGGERKFTFKRKIRLDRITLHPKP